MSRRDRRSLLAVTGAACVACCAGPLWGVVAAAAGVGAATAGAVALFGAVGLAALLLAVPVVWRQRRRSGRAAPGPEGTSQRVYLGRETTRPS